MEQRITVDTIYQKDFRVKNRGYDQEEVDKFLDDIIEEMERLNKTIETLQGQLQEARQARPAAPAPAPAPAPAAQPAATGSIQEVLAMAVKLKEDTLEEARVKAQAIIDEAQAKAQERLGSLEEEHERLTQQVEEMRTAARDYRDKFEALVKAQSEVLEKSSELF